MRPPATRCCGKNDGEFAVLDYIVFSWIADIVIDGQHRGQGLGQWMMECMVMHPAISGTREKSRGKRVARCRAP